MRRAERATCPPRAGRLQTRWGLVLAGVIAALCLGTIHAADDEAAGDVGYAHITGPIDRMRNRYLARVIEQAREQQLSAVVVHIDTDGGEVFHAREMFKQVLDQMRDGPRMIAYVDFRAISAGAMIAYAHEAIYVSETASIGDIGVIFVTREGEMKYAPEKVETVVRTLLAQAAEQRGWNRALLLKMTARNQKLYRVILADGTSEYVIEDDLPNFLVDHPEIDKDNDRQLVLYRGEDRLLTLTGKEAVGLGMATALASDLDALYAQLGVDPDSVVDLSPRAAETAAWYLATVAPLLAGLAFLFILFEIKTPGIGVWAALGALCGALFLLAQYYLDMAENLEVVLVVAGMALVAVEFLTMAGGGLLGIAGAGLAFAGLMLLFLPNELEFDFSEPAFMDALGNAALSSFISLGVVAAGLVGFIALLPRSNLTRQIAVLASVDSTSAGEVELHPETMIGRTGNAREALRPSGTIVVDGRDHSARVEHGTYLAADARVEVIGVQFGELVVRAAEPAQQPAPDEG